MKLKNKETGKVTKLDVHCIAGKNYESLAEINAEWEDYEEPKEYYWYIDYDGGILCGEYDNSSAEKMMMSMGNYFSSIEEAEKAVEKLKAWKRLKDKGFRFDYWEYEFSMVDKPAQTIVIKANAVDTNNKDLDLLFGDEE